MNAVATQGQRLAMPPQTAEESIASLVSQLNGRLRSTTDQLRSLLTCMKSEPNGADVGKPCRADIHGGLIDARDTVNELESVVARLGQLIG